MAKKIIDVWYGTPVERPHRFGMQKTKTIEIDGKISLDPEAPLEKIMECVTKAKQIAEAEGYTELNFTSTEDCGCPYDCSCRPSYYLRGKRLETDLEYEYRKKQEKAQDEVRREREKAEYERLKKQFEGK